VTSRRDFFCSLGIAAAATATARWGFPGKPGGVLKPTASEAESGGAIHLDSNENAYGPSQRTAEAIRAASTTVNRYPATVADLTDSIASSHGVNSERVLLGCGSTDILRMSAQAFLGPGKQLLQASPTFGALGDYASSVGAEVISFPLTHEFAHDVQKMSERIASSTRLIYICNPNNPTASITARKGIEELITKLPVTVFVLIDEAYHEYAGGASMYSSFIDHPVSDDRIIVSRTFSTVYGLAGLRLGYGIASPGMVRQMRRYSALDNVNGIVAQAALVALADKGAVQQSVDRNADDRQEFFNQATARMLKPIDSHANFVMMNANRPAEQVIQHFRQHGILIGPRFSGMETYVRISLGTPIEMKQFWRVWDQLPRTEMRM
jgi:histidinol-phosphate aminotransferase